MEEKSANKKWKESGTNLSFKDWINRENQKKESTEGSFLPFYASLDATSNIQDSIKDTITSENLKITDKGLKDTEDKSKMFGLNKGILVFSTLLLVGSLGYLLYSKAVKKNG